MALQFEMTYSGNIAGSQMWVFSFSTNSASSSACAMMATHSGQMESKEPSNRRQCRYSTIAVSPDRLKRGLVRRPCLLRDVLDIRFALPCHAMPIFWIKHPTGVGLAMADESPIPKRLTVSPESLRCPFCGAEPGKDCATSSGGFSVIHVARIKAAGAKTTG